MRAAFIIKLWLTPLVLISMSACSSTSESESETPQEVTTVPSPTVRQLETIMTEEPEETSLELPCTISLWHSFDQDEIESLLSVAEAYQENQPDVEFDFLYSPNFDLRDKYAEAAVSGGGPSILVGSGEWGPVFYNDLLVQDLSGFVDAQDLSAINSAALTSVQYQGGLIGLPLNIKGVLMFRNAEIMPEPPKSFSDLLNQAQVATSGDMIGAYLDYGLYYSAGLLEAAGGSLMDADGNPLFNDNAGIEWVEMLKRYTEAGPIEQNNDNDLNLFKEGRVGVIIGDLSNTSDLADAIGFENLMIDEWPAEMSGFIESDTIYLNANLTGHDLDCGWSFMQYLISTEAQEMFADPSMAGFIPSVEAIELTDAKQQQAANAFSKGIPLPIIPEMSAYWEPLNYALLSAVELDVDPAEALSAADQAISMRISEMHQEN